MNRRSTLSLKDIPITKLQLPPKTRPTPSSASSFIHSSTMFSIPSQQQLSSTDLSNLHTESTHTQLHGQAHSPPHALSRSNPSTILPTDAASNTLQDNKTQSFYSTDQFSDTPLEKSSLLDLLRAHIDSFSGIGDTYAWFIQLDTTLSDFKISFPDRISFIPYFFVGKPMIWYSLHRHQINDYHDFCQLFALEFLNIKSTADLHLSSQSTSSCLPPPASDILEDDLLDNSPDNPLNLTTPFTPHLTPSSDLHPPTSPSTLSSTISKALIDRFVKDPLKFYGGKDNVMTWLHEIDQQFQIMNLCDPDKLNLIHICLKGEAHQWFQQHPKTFYSWSDFVSQIKHSFHSNLQRDLAFKKLQQYHQTIHQTAFQYYNEMIKLINQADPAMSESAKVHYLMNGLRDSLSVETRRNYPKTTREFLVQVKIAEDLTTLHTSFNNYATIHADQKPFNPYSSSSHLSNTNHINEFSDPSQHSHDNTYHSINPYSNDDTTQPRYLNKISNTPINSTASNRPTPSAHRPASTSYPRPLLDTKQYRPNNRTSQSSLRCFKCGALGHTARSCSSFDKQDQ